MFSKTIFGYATACALIAATTFGIVGCNDNGPPEDAAQSVPQGIEPPAAVREEIERRNQGQ